MSGRRVFNSLALSYSYSWPTFDAFSTKISYLWVPFCPARPPTSPPESRHFATIDKQISEIGIEGPEKAGCTETPRWPSPSEISPIILSTVIKLCLRGKSRLSTMIIFH